MFDGKFAILSHQSKPKPPAGGGVWDGKELCLQLLSREQLHFGRPVLEAPRLSMWTDQVTNMIYDSQNIAKWHIYIYIYMVGLVISTRMRSRYLFMFVAVSAICPAPGSSSVCGCGAGRVSRAPRGCSPRSWRKVADPHGIMISDGSGSPWGGLVLFRDGIILVVSNMFHCQP